MMRTGLLSLLVMTSVLPAAAQVHIGAEMGGPVDVRVISYRDIPFRSVVRQQHDYSCGSAALATLLTYHYGVSRTEAEIFEAMYAVGDKKRIEAQGFSLLEMKLYLESQGYSADGFRLTYDALAKVNTPSIAMINTGNYRHFVVVKGASSTHILVGDPMLGLRIYKRTEFEGMWNGVAFVIRNHSDAARYNLEDEWQPYAPTPWSTAMQAVRLGGRPEIDPLYQIAPIFNLDTVLP
ncbi:MAG TPA: C39 family peptidase [Hyphomonadaceae bacterium]|nr:C39 family peptidase [Hyphomonadaceae bacterium]